MQSTRPSVLCVANGAGVRSCASVITDLRDLANELGVVDFEMQESLYYASRRADKAVPRAEYEFRIQHDFDAQWLDSGGLKERFDIKSAMRNSDEPCRACDPYRMVSKLLLLLLLLLRLAELSERIF